MLNRQGCSVGILRPPAVEASRLMQDQVDRKRSVSEGERAAHVDEQIDQLAEMFRMAVEGLGMRLHLTQYQLHGLSSLAVLSRKRAKHVAENDILATIDPTPSVFRFTTGFHGHPLQRAVLAYTDEEIFEDSAQLLGTGTIGVVATEQAACAKILRRVFAVCTSLNEETAANRFAHNANIVQQAVLYPHIPPKIAFTQKPGLMVPIERLGNSECRRLFVEETSVKR